jgi:methionine aminopeptidase
MVFTIEPMVNEGTFRITTDDDRWTARTADGKLSAQYEHTIAVTPDGRECVILGNKSPTRPAWPDESS